MHHPYGTLRTSGKVMSSKPREYGAVALSALQTYPLSFPASRLPWKPGGAELQTKVISGRASLTVKGVQIPQEHCCSARPDSLVWGPAGFKSCPSQLRAE